MDGRTIGRTDERKEIIQTDRVQADLYLTDGRTHRQTIYDLVDRRRETYTKLYSYICTDGRIDDQIEGQIVLPLPTGTHVHTLK